MFVSFCGLDGCGKTTQVELIKSDKDLMQKFNISCTHGFKPARYSRELKDLAKRINENFELLYSSEMKTMSFIMDLLCMNFEYECKFENPIELVICEKYYLDTIVYSPMMGCNERLIDVMNRAIVQPSLYIMLDISAEESIKRINHRAELTGQEIAPKENIEMARKASKKFIEYCSSNENCIILDASLDPLTLHDIVKHIIMNYKE